MNKNNLPPMAAHMRRAAAALLQEDIDDFFARIAAGEHETVADRLAAFPWLLEHQGNGTKSTPLIVAAKEGRLETVKFLTERGADLEAADAAGMTALMNACVKGEAAVAYYLVESGAKAGYVNKSGLSAASCATAADFPALGDRMKVCALREVQALKAAWRTAADKIPEGLPENMPVMRKITLRAKKPQMKPPG
jgi:hypothetical protein